MVNFLFLSKNVVFPCFSWSFTIVTTDFCQISVNAIVRCKMWTINSFCTQEVSLYLCGTKCLWLKDVFFSYKIRHFYMESIVYPFVNVLEGPSNYFSLSKYYHTDVLHLIENSGFTHLNNIFFFLFLLLYVECTHFLPYTTSVVNKHLYETQWSG